MSLLTMKMKMALVLMVCVQYALCFEGPDSVISKNGDSGVHEATRRYRRQGPMGEKGQKGDKGSRGDPGVVGPKGQTGLPGEGLKGDKGDEGLIGSKGETGDPGAPGPNGDRGDRGLPGLPGMPGIRGLEGRQGFPGKDGLPGANGTKGERGDPGPQGTPGETGSKGDQGVMGDVGRSGSPGETGPKGDRGDPGSGGVVGGGLYTRWGRSSCPSHQGTQLVYGGMAGGSDRGTDYFCFPYGSDYSPSNITGVYFAHAVEYRSGALPYRNAPCAVCHVPTRPTIMTIPGRISCPANWTVEYTGYLMTSNYYRSKHECVDDDPEALARSPGLPAPNIDRLGFYPIRAHHRSDLSSFSKGTADQVITCVVCSY